MDTPGSGVLYVYQVTKKTLSWKGMHPRTPPKKGASIDSPLDVKECPLTIPRHSMYAIYAYIDPSNHPNVGKCTIHGVSGIGSKAMRSVHNFCRLPSAVGLGVPRAETHHEVAPRSPREAKVNKGLWSITKRKQQLHIMYDHVCILYTIYA